MTLRNRSGVNTAARRGARSASDRRSVLPQPCSRREDTSHNKDRECLGRLPARHTRGHFRSHILHRSAAAHLTAVRRTDSSARPSHAEYIRSSARPGRAKADGQ